MLGILAEKQGKLPDAVTHLRKAVELQPRDLRSLYALAGLVSKEGGRTSDADYQRLMEQILKVQPNNLPVLLQRAGAAHRARDQAAFKDTLDQLGKLAPDWSDLSRKTFDDLRKTADPGDIAPAPAGSRQRPQGGTWLLARQPRRSTAARRHRRRDSDVPPLAAAAADAGAARS